MGRPKYEMQLALLYNNRTLTPLPEGLLKLRTTVAAATAADRGKSWVIPCCQRLMLMFFNTRNRDKSSIKKEEEENYDNMKEALDGALRVTLEERSGLPGNHRMVCHHDVTLDGPLHSFPMGAILRGSRIEKTLLLFKPLKTEHLPFGVNASARSYRLNISGSIKGTAVYGAVNVRFEHQTAGGFHQRPNEDLNCKGVSAMGRGRFLTEIKDLSLSDGMDALNVTPADVVYQVCNDDSSGRQRMELRFGTWRHVF